MKWSPDECERGDMIRVKIGSIYHYGVFVSEDEVIAFGLPPVEKYRGDGRSGTVCAIDVDAFSCEKIVERAVLDRGERRKRIPPERTVAIARSRLGEGGYDLLRNNCEHFANECVFGEKRSSQEEEARRRWTSRPICDVYVADVPDEAPDGDAIAKIHPPERASEIAGTANEGLRAARFCDWELMRFAALRSLGIDVANAQFKKKHGGKWECDKFHFSLTHTKRAVAVAVSNGEVGVDMEIVGEIAAKMSDERIGKFEERFFTDAERDKYGSDAAGLAECFTKKEAAFKRAGKGAFEPSKIDGDRSGAVTFWLAGGAVISVCAEHPECVRIYAYDGASATLAKLEERDGEVRV